jgi:preprotein translocase subunit SecG
MIVFLTIIHTIVCLFLIIVVLLQSGKAADLAGAFGGMGSQTAFGPRGSATVLSKATTISAAVFMVTSLGLSILYTRVGATAGSTVLEHATPTPVKQQGPIKMEMETPGGKKEVEIPLPPQGQQAPPKQQPAPSTPAPAAPAKK